MSMETFRDMVRHEITAERVAAWQPDHEHADIVDYVADHECWALLRADMHRLGPADSDHAMILACRYLRFLVGATRGATP